MMAPKVGPGTGLESAANSGEISRGVQRDSYASTYMQISRAHLSLAHLLVISMDGDSKKRGKQSDDNQVLFRHPITSSL